MTEQEQLIWELKRNVEDMYRHEDDAQYIRDNLDTWAEMEYDSEEAAEREAETEEQYAHQIYHVIECELVELSEMLGRKVTIEDFTDGEFSS